MGSRPDSHSAPDSWLEKFYHHIFRSDRRAIAMIEELGPSELGGETRFGVSISGAS